MKKYFAAAAALLLLFSCDRFKVQCYEDELVMPLAENSADSLHLSISLEYASASGKSEVADAINSVLAAQAFDLEDLSGSIEECGARYRENLIDLYLNENEGQEGLLSWEDQIEGLFTSPWKGWKTYMLSYYSFRGGAHGIMTVSYLVFDPKTGAPVSEGDLFREGYKEPVAALLRDDLRNTLADDPQLLEMVQMEQVVPNGNFTVDSQGVTWLYQPYEVAPYAVGILTATASWEQLKPYLKK